MRTNTAQPRPPQQRQKQWRRQPLHYYTQPPPAHHPPPDLSHFGNLAGVWYDCCRRNAPYCTSKKNRLFCQRLPWTSFTGAPGAKKTGIASTSALCCFVSTAKLRRVRRNCFRSRNMCTHHGYCCRRTPRPSHTRIDACDNDRLPSWWQRWWWWWCLPQWYWYLHPNNAKQLIQHCIFSRIDDLHQRSRSPPIGIPISLPLPRGSPQLDQPWWR